MTVYRLLRTLLAHALRGRGRDDVFLSIEWDLPHHSGAVIGSIVDFSWESDADAFCMIEAVSEDGMWSDSSEIVPGATEGGAR